MGRSFWPIYYESRLAKLELDKKEKPKDDPDFEEATEGEEVEHKERLKSKWAALEAVVGTEKRMTLVAEDLVRHWDARLEVIIRFHRAHSALTLVPSNATMYRVAATPEKLMGEALRP